MQYTTRGGWSAELSRIDRRDLDALVVAAPSPPLRTVESWGGVVEQLPIYDDPKYQAQLLAHKINLQHSQTLIIAGGLQLPAAKRLEAETLRKIVPSRDLTVEAVALRYLLQDDDRNAIIAHILYLSTVTDRGIKEAITRFNYSWRDKPLDTFGVGMSHGRRGQLAVDFRAAVRSGLTWSQFCDLPGYEQSMHVAYWLLEDRLNYLLQVH